MSDRRIQWHPGFIAALDLELREYRSDLQFEKEYNLNTKPLEIDLLVIKKTADVRIENEVGRIFRKYNILEYKSPDDSLNIDTFYKVGAYASLYKAYGKTVDEISAKEVTVSFVRERRPSRLFRYFQKHGEYSVSNPYPGIYYVEGNVLFPTQVIVTREIEADEHVWLKALSSQMRPEDMKQLFQETLRLPKQYDRDLAESVLEVSVRANEGAAEALLEGGEEMSGALLELVNPLIQEAKEEGISQGIQQGINQGINQGIRQGISQGISQGIRGFRSLGHSDQEIKRVLMIQYGLTEKDAEEYLRTVR